MVVADTGAIVALASVADHHHAAYREIYDADPGAWVLPWVILPEVDYMLSTRAGRREADAFLEDVAESLWVVAWGDEADLADARTISRRYKSLKLGLVDSVVIAVAERLNAEAIATIDLRHFGAVKIKGSPKLIPRDL